MQTPDFASAFRAWRAAQAAAFQLQPSPMTTTTPEDIAAWQAVCEHAQEMLKKVYAAAGRPRD